MPHISTLAWIALAVIAVLVGVRIFIDLRGRRTAGAKAEEDARSAQWLAEAQERKAAWEAFDADIAQRKAHLEENPTCPEYVISQLVGEDYPRFSAFMRVIEIGTNARPYFGTPVDGVSYPSSMPPKAPEIVETYDRATNITFDTYADAKRWFDLWIEPASRQTAIDIAKDDTLTIQSGWDARDAEGEAGV